MRALKFHGPGKYGWEEAPVPELVHATDAIVRVDAATICGTDLHILRGDVPEVEYGCTLGHEAMGTVTRVGSNVGSVAPGDRVLISCISPCGTCPSCRAGSYGLCTGGGGWVLGHLIDGVQADSVRVPYADNSLYRLPPQISDEAALLLADILPTSYEVGVLNGRVAPADTVVIVGAGPIGLAAVCTARLFSPAHVVVIDKAASRLAAAAKLGADVTITGAQDPVTVVTELTDGVGADVVIEAVGLPETFELCTRLVRAGGRVANVGVHGRPAALHLETLWSKDITITTGLVDTRTTSRLLSMMAAGRWDTTTFFTHRFRMADIMQAYDVFARATETGALKVALLGKEELS